MITNILIITHLLMDFTFQSAKMAERKRTSFKYLLVHSFIYLIGYTIVCNLFMPARIACSAIAVLSVSHFIIDLIRQRVELKVSNNTLRFFSFIADQVMHLTVIISVSFIFKLDIGGNCLYSLLLNYRNSDKIILYILLFVIVWDPASVFIKKMFCLVLNNGSYNSENDLKMGNLIGKLERVIICVLVLLNQYGVIGLVLTAKSIARFRQLEDKDFAEKYLVGTLISLTVALVSTIMIKAYLR